MNILYLGSNSSSRKKLLTEMAIPFQVVGHQADEEACGWELPLEKLVETIAIAKSEHVIIPQDADKQKPIFVLTADSLCCDARGKIHGKPESRDDAIAKIQALNGKGKVSTAFCLEKKVFEDNSWIAQERIIKVVTADYEFDLPDSWIDRYLHNVPFYMNISGGITIDGYGAQFLKLINGSYSTILGLPVFEVRQALEEIGYF
ncbi:Maf family protein [Candidatus Dependentiae bacterium]|nr:Maf family protein [Candidatus Dependentiae bacterium]